MSGEGSWDGSQSLLALDDAVVVVDDERRVLAWNDPATAIAPGMARGDAVAEAFGALAGAALADACPVAPGSGPVAVETRLAADDAAWYEFRVHDVGDANACVVREVTEERARRTELERRETVLQALPVPVYVLDEDGRFVYANDALSELLEVPQERFEDDEVNVAMGMPPDDIARARERTAELLSGDPETGDAATFEMVTFTSRGGELLCENEMAVLLDDGEFRATMGTLREVTDQRRQEQRLEVLERVLRHNLRTEVMIIDGYAERIESSVDDDGIATAAEKIRRACEELVGYSAKTNRVGDAIVASDDLFSTALEERVENAVANVSRNHAGASFDVTIDESVRVTAGHALETVFVELLENAVVHHHGERAHVSVRARTADANTVLAFDGRRERVVVEIADDGPGIPEQERAVVADDGTESPLEHSDGLGLWMASWVVQAYGGSLRIRDREPRGTVIELSLAKPQE